MNEFTLTNGIKFLLPKMFTLIHSEWEFEEDKEAENGFEWKALTEYTFDESTRKYEKLTCWRRNDDWELNALFEDLSPLEVFQSLFCD